MKKIFKFVSISILLILNIFIYKSSADTSSVHKSYHHVFYNKYIFVMMGLNDSSAFINDKVYYKTGLYNLTDNIKPIYTINEYLEEEHLYLSSDGKCLIKAFNNQIGKNNQISCKGLNFYKNGNLIKSYNVSNFVSFGFLLPENSSGYQWIKKIIFSDFSHQIIIETYDYKRITLDISTGEVINEYNFLTTGAIALSLNLILIIVLIIYLLQKRSNKKNLSLSNNEINK